MAVLQRIACTELFLCNANSWWCLSSCEMFCVMNLAYWTCIFRKSCRLKFYGVNMILGFVNSSETYGSWSYHDLIKVLHSFNNDFSNCIYYLEFCMWDDYRYFGEGLKFMQLKGKWNKSLKGTWYLVFVEM